MRSALITVLVLAAAACGSEGDASSTPTSAAAAPTSAADASSPVEPSAICDTIPTLEAIGAVLGEAVTTATDYSRPPVEISGVVQIEERCEVTGDQIANAVFERFDLASGTAVIDDVREQGLVVDTQWPDLPGAVPWANGVDIERDGFVYRVSATTIDTVAQLDAPAAYELSAELLRRWLNG